MPPEPLSSQSDASEHGYVVKIELLLDDTQVTSQAEAESVAERLFEPVFNAEEISAGGWTIEPA